MAGRVGFAGTPALAATCLNALLRGGFRPQAVLTQPDRRSGRGMRVRPGEVKRLALEHGLEVLQPESLDETQWRKPLQALRLDVLVVVAYGLILPPWLLGLPRLGCVNLHFSLLPRWRGAAPIQRAIEAGDDASGLSLIQMDEGLDTGPVLASAECGIDAEDTAGALHDRLAAMAERELPGWLRAFMAGDLQEQAQDNDKACYAKKIDMDETWLEWCKPAEELVRQIQALSPMPGSRTYTLRNHSDSMLKVLRARLCPDSEKSNKHHGRIVESPDDVIRVVCGDGRCLDILEAQLPGERVQPARVLRDKHPKELGPGGSLTSNMMQEGQGPTPDQTESRKKE